MPLSPAMIQALVAVVAEAAAAGRGGKGAVYARACEHLGISRATLHRKINRLGIHG